MLWIIQQNKRVRPHWKVTTSLLFLSSFKASISTGHNWQQESTHIQGLCIHFFIEEISPLSVSEEYTAGASNKWDVAHFIYPLLIYFPLFYFFVHQAFSFHPVSLYYHFHRTALMFCFPLLLSPRFPFLHLHHKVTIPCPSSCPHHRMHNHIQTFRRSVYLFTQSWIHGHTIIVPVFLLCRIKSFQSINVRG